MKRLVTVVLALVVGAFLAPTDASAQISIRAGGAATFPVGSAADDYGSYANTGWMAALGLNVPVGDAGLGVGAHAFFGVNNHSDVSGDKTNLYGGLGSVSYTISTGTSIMPYFFGMVGIITHSYKSTDFPSLEEAKSALAWGGGAGIGFPLGGIQGGIDAYYLAGTGNDLSGTKLFGLGASVSVPVGGNAM